MQSGLTELFGSRLEKVLLYGSYARGEQDEESDIDVMAPVDLPREQLETNRHDLCGIINAVPATRGLAEIPDPHADPPREISVWNQRTRPVDSVSPAYQKAPESA